MSMELRTHEVIVRARDGTGEEVKAKLVFCPVCMQNMFHIFWIGSEEGHPHFQCVRCDETYCKEGGDCNDG